MFVLLTRARVYKLQISELARRRPNAKPGLELWPYLQIVLPVVTTSLSSLH